MTSDGTVISAAGVRMPGIIYGTAWKKERTAELVGQAIGAGFRGIDTACQPKHYDEAGVGAGVAAALESGLARSDMYLQTKFTAMSGQDPRRIPYDPAAPLARQVADSCQASLRNLRTSYLDCLLLHSPMDDARQDAEVWRALEAIVEAGGARQIGISNCYDLEYLEALHASATIKPAVVQNRFYAETGYDAGVRAFCRQRGIVYQSFWTLTANPRLLAHPLLRSLASAHGRTPAQVLFRYLTQEGVVPLTGTRNEAHMREDLEIFDFALTGPEREGVTRVLTTSSPGLEPIR